MTPGDGVFACTPAGRPPVTLEAGWHGIAPGGVAGLISSGRCGICGEEGTVYRSQEAQAGIRENWYARPVREWNAEAGAR